MCKALNPLGIPSDELMWTCDIADNGTFYITTKRNSREWFYIYKMDENNKAKKLGKAHTPTELEDKYVKWGK